MPALPFVDLLRDEWRCHEKEAVPDQKCRFIDKETTRKPGIGQKSINGMEIADYLSDERWIESC